MPSDVFNLDSLTFKPEKISIPQKKTRREKKIENEVCGYANSIGFEHYKLKGTGKIGDIFIYGCFVCLVEFKNSKGGRLTKHQIMRADDFDLKGTPYAVINDTIKGKEFFDKIKATFDSLCEYNV